MKDESILLALWTSRMVVVLAYFVMLTMPKVNSVEGRRSECECGGIHWWKAKLQGTAEAAAGTPIQVPILPTKNPY